MRIKFYDFVSIVEAPDNEPAAHLSIDLGSRGFLLVSQHCRPSRRRSCATNCVVPSKWADRKPEAK